MQNIQNIPTLKSIGSELTSAYKKEQSSLRTKTTKIVFSTESFEFKLGKLISDILSLENTKLISKELALKYGINAIDKRRRSEALNLFSNHSNYVTWLKNNPKKRFTSLSAMIKAYAFENKPKQEDTSEEKEILQIEDKSSEQSDVGQSVKEEPKVQKKLTASDVAFETVLALDTNGISKEEFLVALKEQLELIEENIQLDEVA
jgi:hypothetical protein